MEIPKVYIEKAGNMTKDGSKAILDVCKEDIDEKIINVIKQKVDEASPEELEEALQYINNKIRSVKE